MLDNFVLRSDNSVEFLAQQSCERLGYSTLNVSCVLAL